MIHELGHGLYEQWNDEKLHYSNLHYGASTGMHESQSRSLENFIGRSREFCAYLYGLFEKYFGKQSRTVDQLYRTLNNVRPSNIRIESDEVSYNLHILLRYQIEKEIFSDTLSVSDIPVRWNALMQLYFGITPPDDAQGCLQDVHWSCGYFGYFPTYMLGNLYGAQLFDVCKTEHPNLIQDIEK
jgi:carboxypeptidase Taq